MGDFDDAFRMYAYPKEDDFMLEYSSASECKYRDFSLILRKKKKQRAYHPLFGRTQSIIRAFEKEILPIDFPLWGTLP